MKEDLREYLIKDKKIVALIGDMFLIGAISALIYTLITFNYINFEWLSCSFQSYDLVNQADELWGSENDFTDKFCRNELILRILFPVFYFYLVFLFFCLISPLKSTPFLYFNSICLIPENERDSGVFSALKFVLFNVDFMALHFVFLYMCFHDFALTFHQSANIFTLYVTFGFLLRFIQLLDAHTLTWDEKVSGLRYVLKEKAQARLEKDLKALQRPVLKLLKKLDRTHIHRVIGVVLLLFLSGNVLREGTTPEEYYKLVYQRDEPIWYDNAYFSLAGLSAPVEIENAYEYGKEKTIFLSKRFTDYKKAHDIPYTHNVPSKEYLLYHEDTLEPELHFNKNDLEDWTCLYNLNNSNTSCPSKEKVLSLIEVNAQLWGRFQDLVSHQHFSIPDIYLLESVYHQDDLLNLSFLNSVYILDLLDKGQIEKAVSQWVLFMRLYSKMTNAVSTLVDRTMFLILQKNHILLLEVLLYNNPDIASLYKDEIVDVISIDNLDFYRARDLFPDDWRFLGANDVWLFSGSPNQHKLLLSCFGKMEQLALLPAFEFFKLNNSYVCSKEYPEDLNQLLLKAIKDAGNPVGNIISNLLISGVLKGDELIEHMHRNIVAFKMAMVAMELINNKVTSENVEAYLKTMSPRYWNPISNTPFLWDQEAQALYYSNPDHPELAPAKVFKVRLN